MHHSSAPRGQEWQQRPGMVESVKRALGKHWDDSFVTAITNVTEQVTSDGKQKLFYWVGEERARNPEELRKLLLGTTASNMTTGQGLKSLKRPIDRATAGPSGPKPNGSKTGGQQLAAAAVAAAAHNQQRPGSTATVPPRPRPAAAAALAAQATGPLSNNYPPAGKVFLVIVPPPSVATATGQHAHQAVSVNRGPVASSVLAPGSFIYSNTRRPAAPPVPAAEDGRQQLQCSIAAPPARGLTPSRWQSYTSRSSTRAGNQQQQQQHLQQQDAGASAGVLQSHNATAIKRCCVDAATQTDSIKHPDQQLLQQLTAALAAGSTGLMSSSAGPACAADDAGIGFGDDDAKAAAAPGPGVTTAATGQGNALDVLARAAHVIQRQEKQNQQQQPQRAPQQQQRKKRRRPPVADAAKAAATAVSSQKLNELMLCSAAWKEAMHHPL